MNLDDMIAVYERNLTSSNSPPSNFPAAPEKTSPSAFVDALIASAANYDIRAFHPFLRNLACSRYSLPQLREWVRQHYISVIGDIRRHALVASSAKDCELLRATLSYVAVEADADPVGGAFFSLPQLWIKFGIAIGVTREETVLANASPELLRWEASEMAAVSREGVPVSLFVGAVLDCALATCLGRRLQAQMGRTRDSFDYFWAIAGNRWGDDVGRPVLESWCESSKGRQNVWSRYTEERRLARTAQRLTIMQAAVESISS